jgi:hypothetical protein
MVVIVVNFLTVTRAWENQRSVIHFVTSNEANVLVPSVSIYAA